MKQSKEIRSDIQKKRKVSYDVGEKVGGARKDRIAKKEMFLNDPSLEHLKVVEDVAAELAMSLIKKKYVLSQIDFVSEKEKGTDFRIALIKQAIYDRISPEPFGDSPQDRYNYLSAVIRIQEEFKDILTWEQMKDKIYDLNNWIRVESKDGQELATNSLEYAEKQLTQPIHEHEKGENGSKKEVIDERLSRIKKAQAMVAFSKKAQNNPLSILGERFIRFFTNYKYRNQVLNKIGNTKLTWNDVIEPKKKKTRSTKITNRKLWRRIMPDKITREGGRITMVSKPEDMLTMFQFRGLEFGHYVDDEAGRFHLIKAAESFRDLADILQIGDKDISLNGRLAIAFGARGTGRALAHYERDKKVINMTKNGGAGCLSHEWFHAMDNLLYQASYNEKKSLHFASEKEMGSGISQEAKEAYRELLEVIMAGEAVEMIENTNTGSTAYCVPRAWKSTYLSTNKDVGKTMRILCYGEKSSLRLDIERLKSKYIDNPQRLEQEIKKRNTKHKKELNRIAHIIAYIHYKETNEFLKEIPVSRGHSYFYMDARKRDASRSKPYWSTSYELCARAFEAYIQDKLQDSGRNNDYLVCGTKPGTKNKGRTLAERCMPPFDYPYPLDEERVRINHAFDKFFETLRGNFFTCEMDSYSTGLEDRKKQCMIVPSTTVCFNQNVQFHFDDAGQGVLFL